MLLRDGQSVHRHRLSALLDREVFSSRPVTAGIGDFDSTAKSVGAAPRG